MAARSNPNEAGFLGLRGPGLGIEPNPDVSRTYLRK
jgi:hypothetical protein